MRACGCSIQANMDIHQSVIMGPSISVVVYRNQVLKSVVTHWMRKKRLSASSRSREGRTLKQIQAVVQASWALEPWDVGDNMVLDVPVVRKYTKRAVRREKNHLHPGRVMDNTHQVGVEAAFAQWGQRKIRLVTIWVSLTILVLNFDGKWASAADITQEGHGNQGQIFSPRSPGELLKPEKGSC